MDFVDPTIGAALIGGGTAAVGVGGLVAGVYLTARENREQKRQELVAAELSDYMSAMAELGHAVSLEQYARSLSGDAASRR